MKKIPILILFVSVTLFSFGKEVTLIISGPSILPEGVFCESFPVTITPSTGPIIFIPNVFEYNEQNEMDPNGLLYRAYAFTNNDCE
jgi:hypothetical protein